jgi:UDP-GlcNAc:undecaprenyl-phosphate/decaprenyl-phosphate GlcNAc-1-phosphate transferase
MITPFLVFLVALLAALFVLPKLARIAKVIGLLDKPSEKRKVHKMPRPLVGGIGITISATFAAMVFVPIGGLRGYFLGMAVLLLVGFLDDCNEVGHRQKFMAQIVATSLLIYFSKVSLTSFGDLFGIGELVVPSFDWLIWIVTIFCVVGVVNAINLVDGLDGLAGGISFIAFTAFAIHASLVQNQSLMLLNLALAGAVLGFLRYNWYPSTMFMGDAGSLSLGFSLAFMALALTQGEGAKVSPVCPLLVLAVPITDTLTVMAKRLLRGESPFKADRYHLHHIFMRFGMGREMAVKTIIGITIVMCVISFLGPLYEVGDWYLFLVFLFYFTGYVVSSFFIIHAMRASLRLKKKSGELCEQGNWFGKMVAGHFSFFEVFRKSPRYKVNLSLECRERERNLLFTGTVLNISNDGFMAMVPQLDCLLDRVIAKITFPLENETHSIEIPAEHLWFSEQHNSYYHGFRFLDFGGDKEEIVFKFLVKFKQRNTG